MPEQKKSPATDWDRYYDKPYKTAGFTKPIIIKRMIHYLETYGPQGQNFSITEFGGGNSCFYIPFQQHFSPSCYRIVDNNGTGLAAFAKRMGLNARFESGADGSLEKTTSEGTILMQQDILNLDPLQQWQSDVVFSVGLIEHFSEVDTRKAVHAHLQVLKKGGLLILGFPTPTLLYRMTRKISELLGLWIFHDERPLKQTEVLATVRPQGQLLRNEILWSIILTQAFIILKKQ